jgi:hypothetical protein
MGLIGNYSVRLKSPASFRAGPLPSGYRGAWNGPGASRGRFTLFPGVASHPHGTEPPYSWVIAQQGGSLAAQRTINGAGELALELKKGVACDAGLIGSGAVSSAAVDLIVEMIASLTGSGTVSGASLQAIMAMAASLNGSGEISDAALSLIVDLGSVLTGAGVVTGNFVGYASMSANLTSAGEVLSTANIGSAVWSNFEIETGLSALQAMRLLAAVMGGKLSGAGTSTETFRNAVADAVNRVVAEVDSSGNRTGITYDLD